MHSRIFVLASKGEFEDDVALSEDSMIEMMQGDADYVDEIPNDSEEFIESKDGLSSTLSRTMKKEVDPDHMSFTKEDIIKYFTPKYKTLGELVEGLSLGAFAWQEDKDASLDDDYMDAGMRMYLIGQALNERNAFYIYRSYAGYPETLDEFLRSYEGSEYRVVQIFDYHC